jgi:hypothetical protein
MKSGTLPCRINDLREFLAVFVHTSRDRRHNARR